MGKLVIMANPWQKESCYPFAYGTYVRTNELTHEAPTFGISSYVSNAHEKASRFAPGMDRIGWLRVARVGGAA